MKETGDSEPWDDHEDEPDYVGWRSWIEYENNKTYILCDIDDKKMIKEYKERYGG